MQKPFSFASVDTYEICMYDIRVCTELWRQKVWKTERNVREWECESGNESPLFFSLIRWTDLSIMGTQFMSAQHIKTYLYEKHTRTECVYRLLFRKPPHQTTPHQTTASTQTSSTTITTTKTATNQTTHTHTHNRKNVQFFRIKQKQNMLFDLLVQFSLTLSKFKRK